MFSLFKGSYRHLQLPDRYISQFNFPARWSFLDRLPSFSDSIFVTGSYLLLNITSPGDIYSLLKKNYSVYNVTLGNKWKKDRTADTHISPENNHASDHKDLVTEYQDLKSQHRLGQKLLQLYETPPEFFHFPFSIEDVDHPPHD